LFAVTLFVAPLVYRRLGGSTAAAIAAPAALALVIASFGAADIYWTLPWAVLTLLPWVFLLARRWPRHAWAAVVAIGLLASFATSIRGAAGLPVVLALAYVVFRVPTAWQKRVALVTVLVLSYLAITPLGLSAVRAYRDGDVNRDLDRGRPTSHALWHNTYLGLGFLPNQWRLQYRDELALATVKQTRPHAQFLSSTYIAELRRLFGRAIADDPGYVVKETLQKAVAAIGHTARYLAALVLALTALFVLGRLRSMRRLSLLAAPALLLAVVPPVLVMPIRSYELGLYGAVALLAVSAIAFAAGPALELVRDRRLPPRRAVVRPAVVAAALITTLAATWVAAREIDNRSTAWQAQKLQPPLVP
jgi:hypothetical protein